MKSHDISDKFICYLLWNIDLMQFFMQITLEVDETMKNCSKWKAMTKGVTEIGITICSECLNISQSFIGIDKGRSKVVERSKLHLLMYKYCVTHAFGIQEVMQMTVTTGLVGPDQLD